MWTRRELKEKAKQRFKMNYWKCVLVALLLAVLGGSAASVGGYSGVRDSVNGIVGMDDDYDIDDDVDFYIDNYYGDAPLNRAIRSSEGIAFTLAFVIVIVVIIVAVLLVVLLLVIPLQAFIFNPLEVGIKRFFVRNLNEQPGVREICYAFDHSYMNCVKTLFFRDLYIFLWSLLLFIPGIIKSYEYRMMPYILGERPDIDRDEAFEISRMMMTGNKWKAFVLDLSFLGWYILNGLTFGILGIFYVNPYVEQTDAALYQKLKSLQFVQEGQPVTMA